MNPAEPLRVLIVEDSVLTAEQLQELVCDIDSDLQCSTVATEREAAMAIVASPPHVIMIDLRLKQGNGFQVLRQAAALQPKPLVMVLTNYALPQYRSYALLSGADYFLDKSTSIDKVPKILSAWLESTQAN